MSSGPSGRPGVPFVSDRYRYTLVVPAGWTSTATPGSGGLHPDEPGVDTFRDHRGHVLSVVGEALAVGTGLASWTCAISQHLSTEHAAPVESTESIEVAGLPARLTRHHVRIDPYVIHYLNVELVEGPIGLTLSMESTTGDDPADEALLRSFLDRLSLVR